MHASTTTMDNPRYSMTRVITKRDHHVSIFAKECTYAMARDRVYGHVGISAGGMGALAMEGGSRG